MGCNSETDFFVNYQQVKMVENVCDSFDGIENLIVRNGIHTAYIHSLKCKNGIIIQLKALDN